MNFAIVDDRGLNDLERVNDTKDKVIASLKQDNKLLAKQIEDLLEQKKQLLDNVSKKWYNNIMNTLINNRVRLIQHIYKYNYTTTYKGKYIWTQVLQR